MRARTRYVILRHALNQHLLLYRQQMLVYRQQSAKLSAIREMAIAATIAARSRVAFASQRLARLRALDRVH